MMNITDPAIPPLLQMYPGSRDKTASLSNSEGQDVSTCTGKSIDYERRRTVQ